MGSTQSQKLPTSKVPGGSASGAARGPDFLSGSPLTDLPTPPSPAARSLLATSSGNIMRDGLASGGLKLSAPVGPGAPNRPKDVFQVETVLNGSGLLSRAPGTRFGDDTASAIGQGQQRLNRDHGAAVGRRPLKIDSLINPDGPTQTATRGLARQVADQWRGFEQRRKPALPKPGLPAPSMPKPQRPSVTPVAETPFTADIKHLQDALTADQAGELTRLADGLSKTRTPGAVAGDISDAINTDGLKAVAEFKFIRDRLAKIGTPDQVRALDEAVLSGVSERTQEQLKDVFNPDVAMSREKAIPLELDIDPALKSEILSISANQKTSPTSVSKDDTGPSGEANHTNETDFQKVINGTPDSLRKEREAAKLRIEKIDQRKRSANMGVRQPGKSYARRSDETPQDFHTRLTEDMYRSLENKNILAMLNIRATLEDQMPKDPAGLTAYRQGVKLKYYLHPNTPPAPEDIQKDYLKWKQKNPDGLPGDYGGATEMGWYEAKGGKLHKWNEATIDKTSGIWTLDHFEHIIRATQNDILVDMSVSDRKRILKKIQTDFAKKLSEGRFLGIGRSR